MMRLLRSRSYVYVSLCRTRHCNLFCFGVLDVPICPGILGRFDVLFLSNHYQTTCFPPKALCATCANGHGIEVLCARHDDCDIETKVLLFIKFEFRRYVGVRNMLSSLIKKTDERGFGFQLPRSPQTSNFDDFIQLYHPYRLINESARVPGPITVTKYKRHRRWHLSTALPSSGDAFPKNVIIGSPDASCPKNKISDTHLLLPYYPPHSRHKRRPLQPVDNASMDRHNGYMTLKLTFRSQATPKMCAL